MAKTLGWVFGSVLGFFLLMTAWSYAAGLLSSPDSMAVLGGLVLFAAMIILVVLYVRALSKVLAEQFGTKKTSAPSSDDPADSN